MKRTFTINGKEETIKNRGAALADRKVTSMIEKPKKGKGAYVRKNKHQKPIW